MNKRKLEKLNTLPDNIIKEVKEILKAYEKVDVLFEYGKFYVMLGVVIKAKYGEDFKHIATFKNTDIYTEEERRQNYKEVFGY